jgi:flagellar basal-body rod protein FlgF
MRRAGRGVTPRRDLLHEGLPKPKEGMAIATAGFMISGIFGTLGGKMANARRLDITSNNIANANTPGFKAIRPIFENVTSDEPVEEDKMEPSYVRIPDSYIHFSDASMVQTGGTLDLAIEGDGFFVVSTPGGKMYTRNGQFTLNGDKKLVTPDGYPVLGDGGNDITLDGKNVSIETDGSIYVDNDRVDRIRIVDLENKQDLRNAGKSLYINTNKDNAEKTPDNIMVRQGYFEASNVDVVREMIELIQSLRAYETYTKVDQTFSDILGRLIDLGKF